MEQRGSAANRWDKASSSCHHLQPIRSPSIPWHCRGLGPHPCSPLGCSVPSLHGGLYTGRASRCWDRPWSVAGSDEQDQLGCSSCPQGAGEARAHH